MCMTLMLYHGRVAFVGNTKHCSPLHGHTISIIFYWEMSTPRPMSSWLHSTARHQLQLARSSSARVNEIGVESTTNLESGPQPSSLMWTTGVVNTALSSMRNNRCLLGRARWSTDPITGLVSPVPLLLLKQTEIKVTWNSRLLSSRATNIIPQGCNCFPLYPLLQSRQAGRDSEDVLHSVQSVRCYLP